jgi:hypothetical protein
VLHLESLNGWWLVDSCVVDRPTKSNKEVRHEIVQVSDPWAGVVIVLTVGLFSWAGVFLVSLKLILMAGKNAATEKRMELHLRQIKELLAGTVRRL